ncbi:hypothetical protein ACFV7Q_12090 [Streptomyces sp. NPDC059851]|uniref:hypothetical protein n=1 Tax=Streptomyces sp. NPDC059851 TaxID=3346971 RepID=UPI00364D9296
MATPNEPDVAHAAAVAGWSDWWSGFEGVLTAYAKPNLDVEDVREALTARARSRPTAGHHDTTEHRGCRSIAAVS